MQRCLELGRLGIGYVAPNPMVGAVLVHQDRIIGEGWHQKFGEAHAEVNCIDQAIENGNEGLISTSTLYVSLEPCAHYGKTPPCADLIIKHRIPKVVIGCRDPFKEVDGKGIEKLEESGVQVEVGILGEKCRALNKRFNTFHTQHRPFVILKWAQTADGFIAPLPNSHDSRLLISNEYTNKLAHQWRSEESAILVGTQTALLDNPALTTRLWPGRSPVRLVVDMELKLPQSLRLFNNEAKTIVFNTRKHEEGENILYYQVTSDVNLVHQLINALYSLNIQSLLVEGGARLLQSFIDEETWDEARVITNRQLSIGEGLNAPDLKDAEQTGEEVLLTDTINYYNHIKN